MEVLESMQVLRSADMDMERERRHWEAQQDRQWEADERKRQYKEVLEDLLCPLLMYQL